MTIIMGMAAAGGAAPPKGGNARARIAKRSRSRAMIVMPQAYDTARPNDRTLVK